MASEKPTAKLNDFDELLQQIVRSEKEATKQRLFLKEVRREIANASNELTSLREHYHLEQRKQDFMFQQLSSVELESKLLEKKFSRLQEESDSLTSENGQLNCELGSTKTRLNRIHKDFCEEVDVFSANYSLLGQDKHHQEELIKKELNDLLETKNNLSKEVENLQEMSTQKIKAKEEQHKRREKMKTIQKKIKDKVDELEKLRKKKELKEKPGNQQKSDEFIRLKKEFEFCQKDDLESTCKILKSELDRLQQQLWQRNLHPNYQRKRNLQYPITFQESTQAKLPVPPNHADNRKHSLENATIEDQPNTIMDKSRPTRSGKAIGNKFNFKSFVSGRGNE